MRNQALTIKYSQNFLKDPALVNKLLDKSSIGKKDIVYEVGPGKGVITQELAKRCLKVIGVEKDKKLYKMLKENFFRNYKIEVKLGDFLEQKLPLQKRYKIFSNIPFNITADIVRKLTQPPNPPEDCYLIIQKEAAQKYAGLPQETQLSLLLKPWFELRVLHYFQKMDFSPVPSVDVVLLQIKKRGESLVKKRYIQLYRDFIVYGFNQWEPTLKKAFKKIFTYVQFKKLSRNLGFDLKAKPTDLDFKQWLEIFNYFSENIEENKKRLIYRAEFLLKQQQLQLQKIHRTKQNR